MAGDCTFCRIVEGEEECFDVYEDGEVLAFLDINPISKGQCLVIPKRHVTWFYDMRDDELGSLFEASKEVANRTREAFDVEHVSLFLRGTRIPHVHVFIVPKIEGEENIFDQTMDLHNYFQEKQQEIFLSREEMKEVAERIREA